MTRNFWVILHRWVGLGMTLFLVLVGLTGSLLAFKSELERILAPQLFATPQTQTTHLDLATLAYRAAMLVPQARVQGITYSETDQATVNFIAKENGIDLGFNEFFIDPWTGAELGRRNQGDLSQGLINLMPFIYTLHFSLALGDIGQLTLGVVAVIWALDCFNGFYLTFPTSFSNFWQRWKLSWLIKSGSSKTRLNFDLHRANGLWLWPLLFIFAASSIMMNLRQPIYERIMRHVFDYQSPSLDVINTLPKVNKEIPKLDWRMAQSTGEKLLAELAIQHHFSVGQALGLSYNPGIGTYRYEVRSSRDVFERAPSGGNTYVLFDGDTGALRQLHQPTGEHSGNTIESWLYALHMARVFGLPYRLLVSALGMIITLLAVTGIIIWLKKRNAKQVSLKKQMNRSVTHK